MVYSVMGRILWVDLEAGTCTEENIPEWVYENYLSGLGLSAWLLSQRIPAGADPLGPDNVLGFASGLLSRTGSLMTGRWVLVGKSPLTGGWGDANCGGDLSPAIKRSGYDGIFFRGISPRPVYLVVNNRKAELRNADHLWGKDSAQTDTAIKAELGDRVSIACIGQAGENCSLIAGVVNDKGRLAARSGLGAVMGSKRLKAIALSGTQKSPAFDPDRMRSLSKQFNRWIEFQPPFLSGRAFGLVAKVLRMLPIQMRQDGLLYKILLRKWGTLGLNIYSVETGDAPVQNWRGSSASYGRPASKAINPDVFLSREREKYSCFSCTLGCGGVARLENGAETHKPEYETIIAWSALLMNEDAEKIFEINDLLNRAGMDSISAGATVAFALECFEKGILTERETGGVRLAWGDTAGIEALVRMMISREGIGDLLADGTKAAAERLGKGSAAFAIHAGGQELAMHDGRQDPGYALHAVVEPTPGRHTMGSYVYYEMFQLWRKVQGAPRIKPRFYAKKDKYQNPEEKAAWAAATSKFNMILGASGLCLFGAFLGVQRIPIFEWLNAATGWNRTPDDYMEIGARIQALRREFNLREKLPSAHAINPRATGNPVQTEGANKGRTVDLDSLVRAYEKEMGWEKSKD